MTEHTSDDALERFRQAILSVLGIRESGGTDAEDQTPQPDVGELQKGMQSIRDLLQKFGAALGATGAALMAGLGYTQIHKVFPLPAGSSDWLVVLAAVAGAAALVGAAWLAARFFGAQRRILITSLQERGSWLERWYEAKRRGFTDAERKVRDEVFAAHAREQEANSLHDVELRALRFERIARRTDDPDQAKTSQNEADRLNGVLRLALVQASAEVLERRSHQAFKGLLSAIPLVLTIAGIIVLFGLADWSQGQRDLIALRKSCAEAQKAGAVDACDPVVAKAKRPQYPAQERGMPWLNSFRERKLKQPRIAYRVYGAASQRMGQWVTLTLPQSAGTARAGLALPPGNSAMCTVQVRLPAGTTIRIGHVGPAFGEPGGWNQVEIVSSQKRVTYSHDRPLAPSEGPCP